MKPAINKHLCFVALAIIGFVYLTIARSGCFASEQPAAKRHSLTEAISIILKGQLIKQDDLSRLTQSELQIARNAVFARHGRPFTTRYEIAFYFQNRSWYWADESFTEERITPNDRENVARIQKAERGVPPRPNNQTIEGAMRLYLDAFFRADSDAFLALCHPRHPPRFTGYEIGSLKRSGSWVMPRKDLEADFAKKGDRWMDFFGNLGGMAQYRWTVLGTTVEDWKQDGDTFRLLLRESPKQESVIYVKWQKIDGRYYIAEFSDILV